jgi:hypothetical protein
MQSEHKLALTKNYVLLVNETPVDDILDELKTGMFWEAHCHVFFFWAG